MDRETVRALVPEVRDWAPTGDGAESSLWTFGVLDLVLCGPDGALSALYCDSLVDLPDDRTRGSSTSPWFLAGTSGRGDDAPGLGEVRDLLAEAGLSASALIAVDGLQGSLRVAEADAWLLFESPTGESMPATGLRLTAVSVGTDPTPGRDPAPADPRFPRGRRSPERLLPLVDHADLLLAEAGPGPHHASSRVVGGDETVTVTIDGADASVEFGSDTDDGVDIGLDFPVVPGAPLRIPDVLREVLADLDRIDDAVQEDAELSARGADAHRTELEPAVVYLHPGGRLFVDYWGTTVNTQWEVVLTRTTAGWVLRDARDRVLGFVPIDR